MPHDSHPAAAAPTRRSSRRPAAAEESSQAKAEAPVVTRASLRRQAKGLPPAAAPVARPRGETIATPAAAVAPKVPDDGAPLTRRRARSAAKPGVSASAEVSFATIEDLVVDETAVTVDDEVATTVVVEQTATVAADPADTGIVELPDLSDATDPVETDARAGSESQVFDDSTFDEFAAAAKLFSFTGETPVQAAAPEPAAAEGDAESFAPDGPPHHVSRRPRRIGSGASFRRAAAASFSIGVMGIVGLLAVGMTTPAQAVAAVSTANPNAPLAGDVTGNPASIQAYVTSDQVQSIALNRDGGYTTVSTGTLAAEYGIKQVSNFFTNDPNSPVQWPFAVGVPISYGFGMRDGVMHEGADFTPGEGADVQAIADGTVRIATESGGGYGVMAIIDHKIDGQLVSSRYGHMLYGSLKVKTGDTVKVGQIIGNTGNTGHSFGAHTHFEILVNGTTAIDPIPWLRAHAGG